MDSNTKEHIILSAFYDFVKLPSGIERHRYTDKTTAFLQQMLDLHIIDTCDLYNIFQKHLYVINKSEGLINWFIERIETLLTKDDIQSHIIGHGIILDDQSPIYATYISIVENMPIDASDICRYYAYRLYYQGGRLIEYASRKHIEDIIRYVYIIRDAPEPDKQEIFLLLKDHILDRNNELKDTHRINEDAYVIFGICDWIDECTAEAIIHDKYNALTRIIRLMNNEFDTALVNHIISIYEQIDGASFSLDKDEYTIYVSLLSYPILNPPHIHSVYSSDYLQKTYNNYKSFAYCKIDTQFQSEYNELKGRVAKADRAYQKRINADFEERVHEFKQLLDDITEFNTKIGT